ncbi:antitoxin VbhA family protein [Lacrimispora sp.]|uniref:antitoxin VbhA family protein n=1 Tax=Lacrimispora sp. TaxID=2719234 RepID=UPI00289B71D2|nr:antitoxin VbhA family protein [Lacrimispora sp.]
MEKNTENRTRAQSRSPALAAIMVVVLFAREIGLIKIEKGCKVPTRRKLQNMGWCSMTNEQAWNFAIGIVQLDGIKPSEEFLELVERQKRGEITNEDIRRELFRKYAVCE